MDWLADVPAVSTAIYALMAVTAVAWWRTVARHHAEARALREYRWAREREARQEREWETFMRPDPEPDPEPEPTPTPPALPVVPPIPIPTGLPSLPDGTTDDPPPRSPTPVRCGKPGHVICACYITIPDPASPPRAWVQPIDAATAFGKGERVAFEGLVYESRIPANVWSPAAYPAGWSLVGLARDAVTYDPLLDVARLRVTPLDPARLRTERGEANAPAPYRGTL